MTLYNRKNIHYILKTALQKVDCHLSKEYNPNINIKIHPFFMRLQYMQLQYTNILLLYEFEQLCTELRKSFGINLLHFGLQ